MEELGLSGEKNQKNESAPEEGNVNVMNVMVRGSAPSFWKAPDPFRKWKREPILLNILNSSRYSPSEHCHHTLGYAFLYDITVLKINQLPSRS